jgi:hypothetical protein
MLPRNTRVLLGDEGVYGKKVGEIEKSPNDSLIICEIGRYLSND